MPSEYQKVIGKTNYKPCTDPKAISKFLDLDKRDNHYLFCHLTKRRIRNTETDAVQHVTGWLYKKKMYEHWKRQMIKRKNEYELSLKQTKRKIENGDWPLLKSAKGLYIPKFDSRNVLFRGYPRRCKL